MCLFDSLLDDHHQIAMDNLYNSAAFCRAAFLHLCHGVIRKGGRGAPKCIIQEKVKDHNKQTAVRGTVKAAPHLQGALLGSRLGTELGEALGSTLGAALGSTIGSILRSKL
jgi:hypothetical protein